MMKFKTAQISRFKAINPSSGNNPHKRDNLTNNGFKIAFKGHLKSTQKAARWFFNKLTLKTFDRMNKTALTLGAFIMGFLLNHPASRLWIMLTIPMLLFIIFFDLNKGESDD